jgi:LPXTG-motif cell wall-anchored protein
VDVILNDTTGDLVDPTTVSLVGGTDADGDGFADRLVVPGEGTWTVDAATGEVTFTPTAGFTAEPTPVTYTVDDDEGNTSPPARITLDDPPFATVSGVLWNDVDGDGIPDLGEVGLPGVTVILTCSGPDGELGTDDDTTRTTVTASPYSFSGVPVGSTCAVAVDTTTLPPALAQTFDPDGVLDAATRFTVTGPIGGINFGFRTTTEPPVPTPAPPATAPNPVPAAVPPSLPATGSDAGSPAGIALTMIVLGAALVHGSRRRRRDELPHS